MATQGTAGQDAFFTPARTMLAAAAIVTAVELLLLLGGNKGVVAGRLFDPDCYMHLERSLRLMTQGGWHGIVDPRINAPYGATMHWTVLFDLLLAAGAAPLTLIGLDPHTALFLWGCVISPVLLMAALALYAWGVRRRVKGALFLWLTLLIFTQPQFAGAFLAGRPDHQSLILGIFLVEIGWLTAFFDGRAGWRWTLAAGVLAGVQMCTSVEALLTILLVAGTLAAAWFWFGLRTLKTLAIYLGGTVAAILLWLWWERGVFLLHPAYERVSVVHLAALGSGFVFFAILAAAEDRLKSRAARWGGAALAVAAAVAATALWFPDFFLGPWPHETPVEAEWHSTISELLPLFPRQPAQAWMFLAQYTASLLSLPLLVTGVRRGAAAERAVMTAGLLGLLMFGTLGLFQARWTGEMQAVTLLPWVLTTKRIMQSKIAVRLGKGHLPLRSLGVAGALLLQLVAIRFSPIHPAMGDYNWRGAMAALNALAPPGSIVMAQLWQGPEILWRTDLRVVAGPYEIPDALNDTYAFLDGSEAAAHDVVRRRGIAYVLVCREDGAAGFGGRLAKGRAPSWLEPMALPKGLDGLRLFRTKN